MLAPRRLSVHLMKVPQKTQADLRRAGQKAQGEAKPEERTVAQCGRSQVQRLQSVLTPDILIAYVSNDGTIRGRGQQDKG